MGKLLGLLLALFCVAVGAEPLFPEGIYELMKNGDLGDIRLSPEQMANISARVGVVDERLRWPNRIVPYVIGSEYSELLKLFPKFVR
jgi:hypothetical protein